MSKSYQEILDISIHALREEGDLTFSLEQARPDISIHALREEGDIQILAHRWPSCYFYPRPPRGGRPYELDVSRFSDEISIHALREEGDLEDM